MFSLSIELTSKGKLATVKRFHCLVRAKWPNLPLVINSVDKPNIRLNWRK